MGELGRSPICAAEIAVIRDRHRREVHMLRLPLMAGAFFLASSATFQPGFAGVVEGCAYDRPCIKNVHENGLDLVVNWTGTENFSHYNVRWSRPGKAPAQFEVGGGRSGSARIKNFHSNTEYQYAVQGCNKPMIGRSQCSPWENGSYTTCGSTRRPCRQ